MSVVIETTLGDITVDLYLTERPQACLNFLKLCQIKYYNYNLFHTISRGFIAQTGDPTGSRAGGESIYGILHGSEKKYFSSEIKPRIKHTKVGLISFACVDKMIGSQFFITLGDDLTYLDEKHCVFGEVVEGFDVLDVINEVICDSDDRPYQDVRITHTVILDDPYPHPEGIRIPSRSPSPTPERLKGGRIAPDENLDETEGKTTQEIIEMQAEREAKARATILEMVGDLPDAEMAPPENVLFVCKLNPVTTDDDLEIIFNRFGKIVSCEVIRDRKTGDSLQYAFIEFEDKKSCEDAYFKMDNILIDDRRIHVDFSQSVSKVKWHGKGRGVTVYDENADIGKGNYKTKNTNKYQSKEIRSNKNEFEKKHFDKHRDKKVSRESKDYDYRRNKKYSESFVKYDRDVSHRRKRSRSPRHSKYYKDDSDKKSSKYYKEEKKKSIKRDYTKSSDSENEERRIRQKKSKKCNESSDDSSSKSYKKSKRKKEHKRKK